MAVCGPGVGIAWLEGAQSREISNAAFVLRTLSAEREILSYDDAADRQGVTNA